MPFEIVIVVAVVLGAAVMFALEKLPVDLVAILAMSALLLAGVVTPEEGIAGFGNTATVTVAAMFVLSTGLTRTGAMNFVGDALARLGKRSFWLTVILMMVVVGVFSAFINNTAVVAIFLPIAFEVSRLARISASKLLMPISFASMFGGVCTLIGTSTNILVSSIAERHGQPPFAMFELTPLGLTFFAAGILYMTTAGVRLIPERRPASETEGPFQIAGYLTDIILQAHARSVGAVAAESPLVKEVGVEILRIRRGGKFLPGDPGEVILEAGDELQVRCDVAKLEQLKNREGILLKSETTWKDRAAQSNQNVMVEAVVAPGSLLDGSSLHQAALKETFGAKALAIRHRERLIHERIEHTPLGAGDAVLLDIHPRNLERLRRSGIFVLVSSLALPVYRKQKMLVALAVVTAVVASAAFGWLPIVVSAIAGCALLVLTGCISLSEAYESIDWKVIFLLAGVLTLGTGLEKTGAALLISRVIVSALGQFGPVAVLTAFYLLTTTLTEMMSNNATAALLAPIAIATAESLGVNSRPFLMAVTVAASSSFMTPVGYQTNTLIYGPGQYQFRDFVRVGTPLNVMFWLMATLLIPVFWRF